MQRLIRTAAALAAIAALTACSGGKNTTPDAGSLVCTTLADCSGNQVCLNSACVNICHATSECQTTATPNNVCEEGVCLSPACGNDTQCASGQACLNGACRTQQVASQVASCEVTPNPGDVRAGSTLQLKAVARDADGKPLHFGGITWAAGAGATVGSTSGLLSAAAAGDTTVTATAGTKTCTSLVHIYGAATGLRVTVINMHTKEPVAGAKVVVCPGTPGICPATALTTATDGTVSLAAGGASDVHVFAAGYNYTSFIQTTATDLLVPLGPYIAPSQRSYFSAHLCDSKSSDPNTGDTAKPQCPSPEGEFAPLQDQGEAVHLAFFGSSVPNSLLDLSVDTLVGPTHTVHLTLPGTSTAKDLSLPYGLVLGIGTNFFGTNDPRIFAEGGVRSLWGIGGNVNLSKVITILSPLLAPGANVDIGTLLPQLIGFFGRLEAGAVVGVKAPANAAAGGIPSFVNQLVPLTTPMRLRVDATSPKLPTLDGVYLDGVIAVAGAMNYPMGFVPLGLTAGLSAKDNAGGVLDPTCDSSGGSAPCDTNLLPVKFAPLNGGTEGSDVAVALLAINFGGLSPGSAVHVAVSGQITVLANKDVKYVAPGSPAITATPPAFMKLPPSNSIHVTRSLRNVSVTGDADVAQVYRFELENAARQNWNLWMPPVGGATTRSTHLPDPHSFDASLVDPFADALAEDGTTHGPTARLLALQIAGAPAADALETFSGSLHLDELGPSLKAFTALQVDVNTSP